MSDNLEHLVYGYHGNRQNVMTTDHQFSILLSKSLDCIGYNEDMVKFRVAYWKVLDDIFNTHEDPDRQIDLTIAGSQSEGVVKEHESDFDGMCILNNVICTDTPHNNRDERNKTIFQTEQHDIEPGYTKLKLIKLGKIDPEFENIIRNSICQFECCHYYIYSELFMNQLMELATELNAEETDATFNKSGPALPIVLPNAPNIVHDVVVSFKCYCPDLLRSWLRRPRRHNWPPRYILDEISHMDAHVVPVGCKGSDTCYQEWRICFTKAEIHLIQTLNDTQKKMYIILKMFAKQILKQVCPEITSYIIKNLVLWTSEQLPSELFTIERLGCRIIHALWFLKQCVTQNNLSSYMIPERNLFKGRIEQTQKLKLIELLTSFLEEGPSAVFKRIDKISDAMLLVCREPEMAEEYRVKRDIVEKLYFFRDIRATILRQRGMSDQERENEVERDELYSNLAVAIINIILPEWQDLSRNNVDIDTIINDIIKNITS